MKANLKAILISLITTLAMLGVVIFLVPFNFIDLTKSDMLGTSLTTFDGSVHRVSDLPGLLNTNFTNMDNGKIEISTTTLPKITTLAGLTTASNLATVGTITSGSWTSTDIGVAYGGTGASTFGSDLVILGNGTGALQTVTAGSNDQVLTLVAGVPTWDSATVDETLNYDWIGNHHFGTGSTTINGITALNGFTVASDLLISSSTITEYPNASTSIATKGYVDEKQALGLLTDEGVFTEITTSGNETGTKSFAVDRAARLIEFNVTLMTDMQSGSNRTDVKTYNVIADLVNNRSIIRTIFTVTGGNETVCAMKNSGDLTEAEWLWAAVASTDWSSDPISLTGTNNVAKFSSILTDSDSIDFAYSLTDTGTDESCFYLSDIIVYN